MKKMIFSAVAALMLSASVFATDKSETTVNSTVKKSFSKSFAAASKVSWQKKGDVYFASFEMNNKMAEAAFNEDGVLIATSQVIDAVELPLALSAAISSKYEDYRFSQKATVINYEAQTHYYLNVSNQKQILKLKCSASGDITVEQKIEL
jgi:predicted DNA-binding protein (MmcQ/YjbR family)